MESTNQHIVVAIDGPAASGKSSVAKQLAKRLGFVYVDSGAMYRAITWAAVQSGADLSDPPSIVKLLDTTEVRCGVADGCSLVLVNGSDPGAGLKSDAVNAGVSHVAKIPEVRERLVTLQRDFSHDADIVMEGRDIGSVVFPDTPHKFYIDASPEVRAKRRNAEGLEDAIRERDRMDSTRTNSPLVVAEDAVVVDSSDLTIDQVVDAVADCLQKSGVPTEAL